MNPVVEVAINIVAAAVCIGIGYAIRGSETNRLISKIATYETHVELGRKAMGEVKEEMGNIYQHLQTMDVERQRREQAEMQKIEKMMQDATLGGWHQPQKTSMDHPPVGSRLGMRTPFPGNHHNSEAQQQ